MKDPGRIEACNNHDCPIRTLCWKYDNPSASLIFLGQWYQTEKGVQCKDFEPDRYLLKMFTKTNPERL